MMNYQETLDWMFSRLPMYQRIGKAAFKKDLTNINAFVNELNSPQDKIKTIHVGGTNGKGSTSHMLASILQEAGYNVGLYTSPHLKNFTERIRINGIEISRDIVVEFIDMHKSFLERQGLSFFEMTVGLAFDYFAKRSVDIAIIEVGLGGRLDSTNIIKPEVSVITNIGFDHTQFLGTTYKSIAIEKAGIIKSNTPVVVGSYNQDTLSVFKDKVKEVNATLVLSDHTDYKSDLIGNYQKVNIDTAVTVIKCLRSFNVTPTHIQNGLMNVVSNTNFKGRWQVLENNGAKVICDTAHNVEGLTMVIEQILSEQYQDLHIVLGVVSDKDLSGILKLFPKQASYYFCKPNIERGFSEKKLKLIAEAYKLNGNCYDSVKQAFISAKNASNESDLIFVGGSTFVIAEII